MEDRRQDEVTRELALRAHDRVFEGLADNNKYSNEYGMLIVRSLILINGAAVVALLAFVGSIETGDSAEAFEASTIVKPILSFAIGVGLSALCAAFGYFTVYYDGLLQSELDLTYSPPFVQHTATTERMMRWRKVIHGATWIVGLSSFIAFFIGVFAVTSAIGALGI